MKDNQEAAKKSSKYVLIPVPRMLRDDIDEIVQAGHYVSVSDFVRSACRYTLAKAREEQNK